MATNLMSWESETWFKRHPRLTDNETYQKGSCEIEIFISVFWHTRHQTRITNVEDWLSYAKLEQTVLSYYNLQYTVKLKIGAGIFTNNFI